MNKKRIIILIMLGVLIVLGIFLVVMGINSDKNSPPSGSFIKSYDYIQGDFNKDNLNEMSKAFLEKTTINYGKETKISDDKKTVEVVVKVPDLVKIYQEAFEQIKGNDNSDFMTVSESVKKIVLENLLKNDFEVIANNTVITMVKENEQWYIVPDENFSKALAGNMLEFLEKQFNSIKSGV